MKDRLSVSSVEPVHSHASSLRALFKQDTQHEEVDQQKHEVADLRLVSLHSQADLLPLATLMSLDSGLWAFSCSLNSVQFLVQIEQKETVM